MRLTPSLRTTGLLFASAVTLCAASAHAQTPAPSPAAPAAPATAAPAPAAPAPAAPAPVEAAPAGPAAATGPADMAAAPAPAPAEEVFPAAWTRIDSDFLGLQLWAGATHPLSDTVGIASDVYLNAPLAGLTGAVTLAEFDIGPAITAGKFIITPMLGLQMDLWNHRMNSLVPQLFVTGGGGDPIYMELWVQNYENQIFDKTHATNNLYFRYFIDFTLGKYLALGPEVEALIGLNKAGKIPGNYAPDLGDIDDKGKPKTLVSLPVGLNVALNSYGKNNVLMLFAGYETQKTPSDNHLAGRLTFIHNF